ncbi:hypothetical protein AALB_0399 [Agarivorans albus MKT 106]|uniref:Secreted protein n=1 Tax=Agarivorans albus MKT 106 TaxID=1331007 RepID=R9PG38_AGAAL|nr:hypothetical protein AALB_0399 [Agarivorans albus MKT 106]
MVTRFLAATKLLSICARSLPALPAKVNISAVLANKIEFCSSCTVLCLGKSSGACYFCDVYCLINTN